MAGIEGTRRDFLKMAGTLLFTSIPGVDALGSILDTQPDLAGEILSIRKELSKGGSYYNALNEGTVDAKKLREIADRMDALAKRLRGLHLGVESKEQAAGKYVISQDIPGLGTMEFYKGEKVNPDGTKEKTYSSCNVFVVRTNRIARWTTAYHCIEGTPYEPAFKRKKIGGIDLATRTVENYEGPALSFDGKLTAEDIYGSIGVTIGEKNGIKDAFYSPLAPVTDAFMKSAFVGVKLEPEMDAIFRNCMWKILPPEQGKKVNGTFVTKGRSGSIEIAYDPKQRGYAPAGAYVGVAIFADGPLKGMTIGFVSKPETLKAVYDLEDGAGKFARASLSN